MALTKINTIRRLQLQKAAYELACKTGVDAITIEQIARHAGTSKGIVHHYFRNKQHLLEHVIRYGESLDRKPVMERLTTARSPSEQLWTIIENYWLPESFESGRMRFWLSVMEADIHNKRLAELGTRRDSWVLSKLAAALKQLIDSPQIKSTTLTIFYLMEGSSILAVSLRDVTRSAALEAIAEFLRDNVPRFDMTVVTRSAETADRAGFDMSSKK